MCGLAGLQILRNNKEEARRLYYSALQATKENEDEVATDAFQKLHLFQNLADIIEDKTEEKEELLRQANNIRLEYTLQADTNVQAAHEVSNSSYKSCTLESILTLHFS